MGSFLGSVEITQYRQQLATVALLTRSCVALAQGRGDGLATRYTLRRMKEWFGLFFDPQILAERNTVSQGLFSLLELQQP